MIEELNWKKEGWIKVITGPMFAGKTKKLINCYWELKKQGKEVVAFKPTIDKRYSQNKIISHDKEEIEAIPLERIQEINAHLQKENQIILIDEIQLFFSEEVIRYLDNLAKQGKKIIVSGLDWDNFQNAPISSVAGLLAAANEVIKLTGICDVCGSEAIKTQWKLDYLPQKPSDYVGGAEKYTCRCRLHFVTDFTKK